MYSFRVTTNGSIRNYRSDLYKTQGTLNKAMERVITHRQFSKYSEDPSAASRAFQLRRQLWRTEDQIKNNNTLLSRNDIAFAVLDNIVDGTAEEPGLDGLAATIEAITGTAGSSRKALGQTLASKATAIVTGMNGAQYGDDFLFAGTDALKVPLTWGKNGNGQDVLLYRGIDVNTPKPKKLADFGGDQAAFDEYKADFTEKYGMEYEQAVLDSAKLEQMMGETAYADIGLGFREGEDGAIVNSSAYNSALCALTFLGTGSDENGDPNNLVSVLTRLGTIFSNCSSDDGSYSADPDEAWELREEADRLLTKLHDAIHHCSEQHVKLSADSDYLKKNDTSLKTRLDTLNTQVVDLEDMNEAMAITEMNEANTCYQAALKIGNDLLSQSLLDYLR